MKLKLIRETFTDNSTMGSLFVNDEFVCYTLEGKVREKKEAKATTAIPYGTFPVEKIHSSRFKKNVPLVKGVPGFYATMFQPGNIAKDTDGGIAVGMVKLPDFVGETRPAFQKLMDLLSEAWKNKEPVELLICK